MYLNYIKLLKYFYICTCMYFSETNLVYQSFFQTEEEGSEVESAAVIVTNDSESNSSSSEVRLSEPEMKQGKCKVL